MESQDTQRRWCKNLGQNLIKSMELLIDDIVVHRYINCQKCHTFHDPELNDCCTKNNEKLVLEDCRDLEEID